MASAGRDQCIICSSYAHQDKAVKWMGCDFCSNMAHRKCANFHEVTDINETQWLCGVCVKEYSVLKVVSKTMVTKLDELKAAINDMKTNKEIEINELKTEIRDLKKNNECELQELKDEVKGLKVTVQDKLDVMKVNVEEMKDKVDDVKKLGLVQAGASATVATPGTADALLTTAGAAWATVVSKGSKKKNLLILKATVDGEKAREKKEEVTQALTGVQIKDSRFSTSGNIIMNFESETDLEDAAEKLKSMTQISTTSVKKLLPKVMICNVSGEESEDDLIKNLIDRNACLHAITDVETKIKIVAKKQAAGGTFHYILKLLDPKIRSLLNKNNDRVLLPWGVQKVIDRYHPLMCFHCQRYGHIAENCRFVAEPAYCFRCAEPHRSRACPREQKKCINCVRYKHVNTNHSATDYSCPIFTTEQAKIRDLTDHGD